MQRVLQLFMGVYRQDQLLVGKGDKLWLTVWLSGNTLVSINEVILR